MANPLPLSKFEEMITNNGPVQTSIMQNLTRWEFRNLQMAGVRLPISRTVQRKYQIPDRCDQRAPEIRREQCANTTESFDEIKACMGYPQFYYSDRIPVGTWQGAQWISPCLQRERGWWDDKTVWRREPNTDKYPIHSKVCRSCRDFHIKTKTDRYLQGIARFGRPLCKQHGLEHTDQFPHNACRCAEYINSQWRCSQCSDDTMRHLMERAFLLRRSLTNPSAQLRANSQTLSAESTFENWNEEGSFCPIRGCVREPWLDETEKERMQMCLGCNAISRI